MFPALTVVNTFIQGIFFDVSSVSLESLGLSGGWSSLKIPGDSSPLISPVGGIIPATPGSEVSDRSDKELTFLLDWIESVRLTCGGGNATDNTWVLDK